MKRLTVMEAPWTKGLLASTLRDKLVTEQDETRRQILLRLLAEEEAKLATLGNDPSKKKGARISAGPAILASGSGTPRSSFWFPR